MDDFDRFLIWGDDPQPATPAAPPPAVRPPTPDCRHTIWWRDPAGTWLQSADGARTIVECRHCGKFYGYYIPPEQPAAPTPQERTRVDRRTWQRLRKPAKDQAALQL